MTSAVDPRSIVVHFPEGHDAAPELTVGNQVTVGQLVMVAWELERQAQDARQGAMIAQAQRRAGLVSVPGLGRNGGPR